MILLRKHATGLLVLVLFSWPVYAGQDWDAIQQETREALAKLSREYLATDAARGRQPLKPVALRWKAPFPRLIVIGFAGGWEGKNSKVSGVVAMRRSLEAHAEGRDDVLALTYNSHHWRDAASRVLEIVREVRQNNDFAPGIRQPLIVVYGHSWGTDSIGNLARKLTNKLEISLAIYIDPFSWRNPRVPDNVRYAINFYQRAGIFRGFPVRGKTKLIPVDPRATHILGSYRIKPQTERWGWSWNLLQPLLYRQHHRIAHDLRLQNYLLFVADVVARLQERFPDRLSRHPDQLREDLRIELHGSFTPRRIRGNAIEPPRD